MYEAVYIDMLHTESAIHPQKCYLSIKVICFWHISEMENLKQSSTDQCNTVNSIKCLWNNVLYLAVSSESCMVIGININKTNI